MKSQINDEMKNHPMATKTIKENKVKLTDRHLKILDERKDRHPSGKDSLSSWQNAHDKIRRKRKSNNG